MSKFNKIVIFTINPITNDYARRYGVEFFNKNNIEVIFINLCVLIYGIKKTRKAGYDKLNRCKSVTEISITSYKELYSYFSSRAFDTVIYLNLTPPAKLLAMIWKMNLPYISGSLWGGIQNQDWMISRSTIFKRLYKKFIKSPLKLIRKFNIKLEHLLCKFIISNYPPILTITKDYEDLLLNQDIKTLLNHTFDYDRFLLNKELIKPSYIPENKYHVLLPNHAWMIHDYIINDAESDCVMTKDRYTYLINKTLDKIESLTKIEIIVAGYPNATKDEDIYINRHFFLEAETEQLIKYSEGVITHFTGAINFAVIHKKPVCIINYTDFLEDPRFINPVNSYAQFLGVPVNYVDNDQQVEDLVLKGLFSVNNELYRNYRHKFIRSEEIPIENEKLFWQRVLENI